MSAKQRPFRWRLPEAAHTSAALWAVAVVAPIAVALLLVPGRNHLTGGSSLVENTSAVSYSPGFAAAFSTSSSVKLRMA